MPTNPNRKIFTRKKIIIRVAMLISMLVIFLIGRMVIKEYMNSNDAAVVSTSTDTSTNTSDTTNNNSTNSTQASNKDYFNWFKNEYFLLKKAATDAANTQTVFLNSHNDSKKQTTFEQSINNLKQMINSNFSFPKPADPNLQQFDSIYRNTMEQLPTLLRESITYSLSGDQNKLNEVMNEQSQLGAQIDLGAQQIFSRMPH